MRDQFAEDAKRPFALKDDEFHKARWGWLADKHLADISNARKELAAVRREIDDNRRHDLPFALDPAGPRGLAVRAVRLEQMDDREKAGRVWAQLAELTEKDPEKREWYLLAGQQRALPGKAPEDAVSHRVARIEAKYAEADALAKGIREGEPEENRKRMLVRVLCREITDLYEEEANPVVAAVVKKARALAATVPKR